MRLFPKKHFQWTEPKAFRQQLDAFQKPLTKWWFKPLAALFIVGILMGQWYLNHFVFHKVNRTFGASILVAFGFSAFLIYFMPWLIGRFPQTLWLSDDGLCRVQGNAATLLKYEDIASFQWRVNDDFATLSFERTKGKGMVLIGVPLDISREAISQFLIEKGIAPAQ